MKAQSKTLLFSFLAVIGLLVTVPSAVADEEEDTPVGTPNGQVPEGVSTLVVLSIALGGIAVGRKFLK